MRVCTGCIDRERDEFCGNAVVFGWGFRPEATVEVQRTRTVLTEEEAASVEERSRDVVQRHYAALGDEANLLAYHVRNYEMRDQHTPGSRSETTAQSHLLKGEAHHIPPNTVDGVPIETDYFKGSAMLMYRPACPFRAQESPHARHFSERRRAWEFRVQGQFKRAPTGDMFIGIVLRDFNYNQAVERTSKWVKKAGMALVKYDLYMSWGDRCKDAEKPDAECSHLVTNMTAWDQIIITPNGKQPPLLKSDLQQLERNGEQGRNLMRKEMGLPAFSEAVETMVQSLDTSATYTMCFWGVSQVIDVLNWNFKFQIGNIAMARFFEEWPIHICMYELNREGTEDVRHLESRKKYYLDFMFWSNLVECPQLTKRYVFRDAPHDLEVYAARACGSTWSIAPRAPNDQPPPQANGVVGGNVIARTTSGNNRGRTAMLLAALRWMAVSACPADQPRAVETGRSSQRASGK